MSLEALDELVEGVARHLRDDPTEDRTGYVGSELAVVNRALARIQAERLAPGQVFCEWGSGLGGACGVAALNGFRVVGIEIGTQLVASARSLASELDLDMAFAEGTFLLPGDEDLVAGTVNTSLVFDSEAWDELEVAPEDCSLVFAYPWPGEESLVDRVFARHASPDALLLTFHGWDHVLLQCKEGDQAGLRTVGWL